nr:Chain D, PucSBC1 [synthetic construct]
DEVTSTTSSS